MNTSTHSYLQLPIQCQSRDIGLSSLYCLHKWRTISKTYRDFDLYQKMPNIELVRAIFIYYLVLKFDKHIAF